MKQIKLFEKSVPVLLLALFVLAGTGSALLLSTYWTITGTGVVVDQSIEVLGENCSETTCTYQIGDSPATAGSTYIYGPFAIKNNANNPIPIKIVTTISAYYGEGNVDASDAMSITYFGSLKMDNKNPSTWQAIEEDTIEGTLEFEIAANTFNYRLDAEGLSDETEYSLIYYADYPDRFNLWGGDNPGKLIATGTPTSGVLLLDGNVNIDMNLPEASDWNKNPDPDYCENHNGYDNYDLCSGAKLWLVPSSDYDAINNKVINWNPTEWLFETDLITYDDINFDGEALYVGHGQFDMYLKVSFDPSAAPGSYTITTSVNPV